MVRRHFSRILSFGGYTHILVKKILKSFDHKERKSTTTFYKLSADKWYSFYFEITSNRKDILKKNQHINNNLFTVKRHLFQKSLNIRYDGVSQIRTYPFAKCSVLFPGR